MANHNTACFDLAIWYKKNSRAIKNTRKGRLGNTKKAHQMFKNEIQNAQLGYSDDASFVSPKIIGPVSSEKEKLAAIADSLGIIYSDSTTEEQLRIMISERMQG